MPFCHRLILTEGFTISDITTVDHSFQTVSRQCSAPHDKITHLPEEEQVDLHR
jgi:hypothetical protein